MNLESLLKGPLAWASLLSVLAVICGIFIWDLSADQAEQRIRGEQSTQYHIEYAEDRIDEKCLSLEPIPMRDCIHEEIEAARDHDRANQDLNAQQQMAFFTKIMGATAVVGLALGAVSIFVIFATLSEMGRTNQIMREEQRPWLVLDGDMRHKILRRMYRSSPKKTMAVNATNKGRLPAKDAICTFAFYSRDTISGDDVSAVIEGVLLEDFDRFFFNKSTIFQGENAKVSIEPMPSGHRVFGKGDEWCLLIACFYFWEDAIKLSWKSIEIDRPPESVIEASKY
ncbi:hypothetical protein ACFIO0_15550 [Pseudosulfitobacter sp. SM2401]